MSVKTKRRGKTQAKGKMTRLRKMLWAPFCCFSLPRQDSHWLSDTDVFLSAGEGADSQHSRDVLQMSQPLHNILQVHFLCLCEEKPASGNPVQPRTLSVFERGEKNPKNPTTVSINDMEF